MNIIPFSKAKAQTPAGHIGFLPNFQIPEMHTTAEGIQYYFQQEMTASVSSASMVSYFQSLVEYNLLLPKNTHGFAYFEELLHTLSYASYKLEGNKSFLLPENTIYYIHQRVGELNIFECKNIIVQIERILQNIEYTPQLKLSYNYIRSVVFTRFEELKNDLQKK